MLLFVVPRFKGSAFGCTACCGVGGTDKYLLCGTIALTAVMSAIFNIANDSLKMFATAALAATLAIGVELLFQF